MTEYADNAIVPATPDQLITHDANGWVNSPYKLMEVGAIELPFGYIDRVGTLHKVCEVHPMGGEEEDMLTSPRTKRHMLDLLTMCVTKLGPLDAPYEGRTKEQRVALREALDSLILEDQTFILIALRRVSFPDGHIYKFRVTCPNKRCEDRLHVHALDLRELVITPAPTPLQRLYEHVLPLSKKTVRFGHATEGDTKRLNDLVTQSPESASSIELYARTIDVDGAKLASYADLKKWSSWDRDSLRGAMSVNRGGIDLRPTLEACPSCGVSVPVTLEPDLSFFRPALVK